MTSPSVVGESPRPGPFAEFERTIPSRGSVGTKAAELPAKPVEVVIEEREPEEPAPLPVITPAGASVPRKPIEIQPARSRSLEPAALPSDDPPQGLFSKSAPLTKELPDVTDTTTAAKDPADEDAEPSVRPRDVSVLVEQVFEDLRQRRVNDARQRTEWLKQLVKKRASAGSDRAEDEVSLEVMEHRSGEPRRLTVDPMATAVEKPAPETVFGDEESTSRK